MPAHEVVADLLLEAKRYPEAVKEYEASLKTAPGRYRALYGAAKSSELAGDYLDAKAHAIAVNSATSGLAKTNNYFQGVAKAPASTTPNF
jgi:hypothetical protein